MLFIVKHVSLCLLSLLITNKAAAQEVQIPPSVLQDNILLSDKKFHLADTDAEKVLNAILTYDSISRTDDRFGFLREYIVDYPGRNRSIDHLYDQIFSNALKMAWKNAERTLVQQECDGQYLQGELCGLGFNPLLCAQDISETGYLYRTEYQTEQSAVITYAWGGKWKGRNEAVASYVLMNNNGKWVLDGVNCFDSGHFNWPAPTN